MGVIAITKGVTVTNGVTTVWTLLTYKKGKAIATSTTKRVSAVERFFGA